MTKLPKLTIEKASEEEIELHRMVTENGKFYGRNIKKLRSLYPDEYVAICDNEVVDHDSNEEKLARRLRENYSGLKLQAMLCGLHLRYVYKDPPMIILAAS